MLTHLWLPNRFLYAAPYRQGCLVERSLLLLATESPLNDIAVSQSISDSDEKLAALPESLGFETLYQRHAAHLLAYLTRQAGHSNADDLAQEVWVKIHRSLPKHFVGGTFKSWLFAVAKNQHLDHTRKRPLAELKFDLPDESPSLVDVCIDDERHKMLRKCLGKLRLNNVRSAEVFTALLEGRDADELCKTMALEAQQIYNIKNKTITFLQDCVGREGI